MAPNGEYAQRKRLKLDFLRLRSDCCDIAKPKLVIKNGHEINT